MSRTALIIGTASDNWGGAWDVRESRDTAHGFPLLIGWPSGLRGKGFGGPRLIPTTALVEYFAAVRLSRDGSMYDLPMGRTAIKRVRKLLGENYYDAAYDWWMERMEDLIELQGSQFAAKHGVYESVVSAWRSSLLGYTRTREPFWWLQDSCRSLLASAYPAAYVADRLDIAVGTVGRLRWMLAHHK